MKNKSAQETIDGAPGRHRGPVAARPNRALLRRALRRGLMVVTTLGVSVALATNSLAATQVTVKNPGGLRF